MKFEINQYLTVVLEKGLSQIYVQNKKIYLCYHIISSEQVKNDIDNIDSIDNLFELDQIEDSEIDIDPNDDFWGLCSCLQVWAEYEYDTKLLHSNFAFPLLYELTLVGDPSHV